VRTARFEFDIRHIREFGELPEGVRFLFLFDEVRSARATVEVPWPAPLPETRGKSREEVRRLLTEHRRKGREESITWDEIEQSALKSEGLAFDADYAENESGVAFRLFCNLLQEEMWPTLTVSAGRLRIERSDGAAISLDELVRLGEGYWDAFDSKKG
jgi:hypothetical protein